MSKNGVGQAACLCGPTWNACLLALITERGNGAGGGMGVGGRDCAAAQKRTDKGLVAVLDALVRQRQLPLLRTRCGRAVAIGPSPSRAPLT